MAFCVRFEFPCEPLKLVTMKRRFVVWHCIETPKPKHSVRTFFTYLETYFAKIENQRHTLETLSITKHIHLRNQFAKHEFALISTDKIKSETNRWEKSIKKRKSQHNKARKIAWQERLVQSNSLYLEIMVFNSTD